MLHDSVKLGLQVLLSGDTCLYINRHELVAKGSRVERGTIESRSLSWAAAQAFRHGISADIILKNPVLSKLAGQMVALDEHKNTKYPQVRPTERRLVAVPSK